MARPIVAVVGYRLAPGRVSRWDTGAVAAPDSYLSALHRAGLEAGVVAPSRSLDAEAVLGRFDGLLLIGGGDVEPELYGEERHLACYGMDAERDAAELGLVRVADRLELPTFAICRGIQAVNVAFGGTLYQHLPDLPGLIPHGIPAAGEGAQHEVKVMESSRLAKATGGSALACASHHHQGLDRLGDGLIPVAWSEDGLIEAVERERGWFLAVQWHPEDTAPTDPSQQALFEAFAEQARRWAQTETNAGGRAPWGTTPA